ALSSRKCSAVFAPTVADVYPRGLADQTTIEVPGISDILCGASRPGHFRGVATIVAKLFNMVQPDIAIFGEKDFQQLQVIRLMTADLSLPVTVLGMPTERASDGLALSSRNGYLNEQERALAPIIYQTIRQTAAAIQAGGAVADAEHQARQILSQQGLRMDYIEVRRRADLQPPQAEDRELVILVAVFLGKTRLIDNITFDR
ncbi:MAG TPA: pantoate--beta-alanine ligase, partial [Pseudidiomarina sp.]|nr:pantoate--beta-alanine ligase [Pseudidiomarina sp.]